MEFQNLVHQARISSKDNHYGTALSRIRSALDLWRGAALSGVSGYFFEREAQRLEEFRLSSTEEMMALELTMGNHEHAVCELRKLLNAHPSRQRLAALLMLALHLTGRSVDALDVFMDLRNHMINHLGLGPDTAIKDLHQAILRADTSASPRHVDPPYALWRRLTALA
ncbi:AfsR/SARP family transcriptional regulator [Phytoactinopolyspora endophytica]|uniref:AfsR/SARP family transcriptional regulator n=1 Tax=Phytoactinopolyspora endophytica TaxID=1642495 RepID=UPI003B8309A8